MTQTDLATTPAALACTLTGAYLIEASAGTGKTWTLTGIILRLLIEKNHAPENIIATTFTNAAAREIEERISLRLQDFLRCCVWLKERLETVNLYTADHAERQMAFDQAVADGWTMLADPVNAHLLHWLLESHPRQIDVVIARIRLTLMSLNKLFVGTLDSLAQKWLTEFSAQVGHDDTRVMNSEPKATIYAIIHDALRAERTRLYHEMPLLYQLTTDKKFFDTEYMVDKLWNALQFFSAKIDVPDCPDVDGLAAQLLVLAGYDYSAFEAYADADFRSSQEIKKNKRPFKAFDRVIAIIEMLSVCDSPMDMIESCLALESDDIKLMGELSSIDREAFSKKGETFYEIYQNLPNVDKLTELGTTLQALQQTSDAYEGYLIAQLGETVRCLLAERLQTQGETTFIIETARLNDALAGRHGAALARHIRHLYPVMLIDEAQDMNGEQASIVKRIYLQNDDQSQGKVRWFLLFVGDPKQAIYRFRGGDVANFNHLKGEQVNSKLSLTVNHRSHPGLIDSLNAWYGQDTQDDSRPKPSELGRGIHYQPISAHKEATHRFTSTLIPKHRFAVLHLQYEQNKKHGMAMFVAAHIASLLNDEAASGKRDHLRPTDIAVLARTTAQLHEMATALERYGVPAVISRDASVFETAAAQDMYQLLLLVSEPDDERLGAYLMSPMVGKSWLETAVIIQDPIAKGKLMYQLKALHARWAEDGVNAMLNLALAACVLTGESVWERVAKTAGERYKGIFRSTR